MDHGPFHTRCSGAYDAGVSVVGISNLPTFLHNTAAYRRSLRLTEYGDPESDADAVRHEVDRLARQLEPVLEDWIDLRRIELLIVENAWAIPFVKAVRSHGGELVASLRIPAKDVMDALDALESTSTESR